jgi:hypothetical protein
MPDYDTDLVTNRRNWGQQLFTDGATWSSKTFTLTPTDGSPANSAGQFRGWVYPRQCVTTPPTPGEDACIPVADPGGGVGVRFRKLVLTVDDPTNPLLTLAGVPPDGTFTNQTTLSVSASASDPQSGIATLAVQRRAGGGTRTIKYGSWKPDLENTTPRAAGTPPLTPAQEVTKTIALKRGTNRIVGTATNGAGAMPTATPAVTFTVDVDAPVVKWASPLKSRSKVRVTDRGSKIASGSVAVGGTVIDTCTSTTTTCALTVRGEDGQVATVTAVDRAGNTVQSTKTIGSSGRPTTTKPYRGGQVRVLNGTAFRTAVGPNGSVRLLLANAKDRPARLLAFRGTKATGTPVLDRALCPPPAPNAKRACPRTSETMAVSLDALGLGASARSGRQDLTFVQVDTKGRRLTSPSQVAHLRVTLDRDGPAAIAPSPASAETGSLPKGNAAVRRKTKIRITIKRPAADRPAGSKTGIRDYAFTVVDDSGFRQLGGPFVRKASQVEKKTVEVPWKAGAAGVVVTATDRFGNVGVSRTLRLSGSSAPSGAPAPKSPFVYGLDQQAPTDTTGDGLIRQFFEAGSAPMDDLRIPRGVKDASGRSVPMTMLRYVVPIDSWAGASPAHLVTQRDLFFARANALNTPEHPVQLLVTFMPAEYLGGVIKDPSAGDTKKCTVVKVAANPAGDGPPPPLPTVGTAGGVADACRVPDAALYGRYVRQWIAEARKVWTGPLHIGAWNEPDVDSYGLTKLEGGRGVDRDRLGGQQAAKYWIAADEAVRAAACGACSVVAGEFSSASTDTLGFIEGFIDELRARGKRPKVWGFHNYEDLLPALRPSTFVLGKDKKKNLQTTILQTYDGLVQRYMGRRPFELWDTETGVLLQKTGQDGPVPPTRGGRREVRLPSPFTPLATKATLAYDAARRFGQMRLWSPRLTHAVYYGAVAPDPATGGGFDSAYGTSSGRPRPAFCGLLGLQFTGKPDQADARCVWDKYGRGE